MNKYLLIMCLSILSACSTFDIKRIEYRQIQSVYQHCGRIDSNVFFHKDDKMKDMHYLHTTFISPVDDVYVSTYIEGGIVEIINAKDKSFCIRGYIYE